MGFLASLLAALAISQGGVTYQPFIRGYEHDSHWVVSEYFIGREWPCRGQYKGETCFAGYEYGFDDAAGLVTGP